MSISFRPEFVMLTDLPDRLRIIQLSRIATLFVVLVAAGKSQLLAQCSSGNSSHGSSSCGQCDCLSDWGCGACDEESLWTRPQLFGDWLGARSGLAEHGIIADLYLTQFYQGVASGGAEQTFEYGGKLDYEFTFVGEKLGLNKGLFAFMHAETRYGEDVNVDAGALAFPNTAMLFPYPEKDLTSISGLYFLQALNEKVVLTIGKYRTLDLFAMIYPDAKVRGVDGFMNLQLLLPLTLFRTTDLALNGAGVLGMKGKQVQSGLLVYDAKNVSTTMAPDLFGEGVVILGYHRFFTDIGGLPGSHAFLGNWSSRTYTSTDRLSWTVIPGEGLVAGQETGSWSLAYFLDQTLWADRCNEKRNIRLFSVWGLADSDPNPWSWTGNVSLQGSGLICGREADTMGVGYFYAGLSSDFKQLVGTLPTVDLQDVQGVELYYNAAITPWFHLTTDLQVIDNENVADDTAIVVGLRGKIKL
jgi:porin